jgi:Bacteriodetes cell division protein (FtsL-like)
MQTKPNWTFKFNYQWVVGNIPFFLFCAFLCVLYIANGHYGEKMIRRINKLGKQNKELTYEYKTLNGSLMFKSKQSELVRAVSALGLQLPSEMPIVITDSTTITIQ